MRTERPRAGPFGTTLPPPPDRVRKPVAPRKTPVKLDPNERAVWYLGYGNAFRLPQKGTLHDGNCKVVDGRICAGIRACPCSNGCPAAVQRGPVKQLTSRHGTGRNSNDGTPTGNPTYSTDVPVPTISQSGAANTFSRALDGSASQRGQDQSLTRPSHSPSNSG